MDIAVTRITEFLQKTEGNKAGKCIFCAYKTQHGHEIDLSDNFTAWNLLEAGDCICEYCYILIKNQDFRRRSWVISREGVKFLERNEILPTLLNPPEPPFAIHIAKSGKKQGFIRLINFPALNKDFYQISYEDAVVFVEREKLKKFYEIVRKARELKFSKSELMSSPNVKNWVYRELCLEIVRYNKDPLWEVVVFAVE